MASAKRRETTPRAAVFWLFVGYVFVQPWRQAVTIRPGLSVGPVFGAVLVLAWIVTTRGPPSPLPF